MARKEGGSVDNKVTPSVPRTDGVTSLPTIPPFLTPAAALLHMPPPSHERPHFVAAAQPFQPLPVAQLGLAVAPREVVVHAAMLLRTAALHGSVGHMEERRQRREEWWYRWQ